MSSDEEPFSRLHYGGSVKMRSGPLGYVSVGVSPAG